MGISPKGGFVIATGFTYTIEDIEKMRQRKTNTYIFNREGKLIKVISQPLPYNTFSNDQQLAILYGGGYKALLFEFFTGNII